MNVSNASFRSYSNEKVYVSNSRPNIMWFSATSSLAKSSTMDTIPTSLLLACGNTFSDIIAYLANLAFSGGTFPTRFKSASVTPLLKGDSLDKNSPSNYRPISNLNFISKILERLFPQPISTILASDNFNRHQSAYRPGHSTESALLLLVNNVSRAAAGENQRCWYLWT